MKLDERDPSVVVEIVRTLDAYLEVMSVRTHVYMAEQNCPYREEFDGNDLCGATHLLARVNGEPAGTLRLRWFGEFAKVERVAVREGRRSGAVSAALVRIGLELAARKGYRKVIGHIQARLLRYWGRAAAVNVRPGRPRFAFSDFEYVEIERDLDPPADAISLDTPAMVLLRPEGDWDRPGILDHSAARGARAGKAA